MTFIEKFIERTDIEDKTLSDTELVKTLCMKLSKDISKVDNQELAGKMLIHLIVRRCKSFKDYLELYNGRLNNNVLLFFQTYTEEIQVWLTKHNGLNYNNKDYFSSSTIIHNFLLRIDAESEPIETPLIMWVRIATQLYYDEPEEIRLEKILRAALNMAKGYYVPSSPTIFNAGTRKHQLASCFLVPLKDCLDDILYTGVGDAGKISSLSGGLGLGITSLRHSDIDNSGVSNGVVPACKVFDKLIRYANQSGRRSGSATAFLSIWHIDIIDFISATDNYTNHEQRFSLLNTCVWTVGLFFNRLERDEDWTLFCPAKAKCLIGKYGTEFNIEYLKIEQQAYESGIKLEQAKKEYEEMDRLLSTEGFDRTKYIKALKSYSRAKKEYIVHKVVKASEIYDKIIDLQVKSGMPYICHGDAVNAKSNHMHLGKINNSNLCLEIMEWAPEDKIASCNLSSLNLSAFASSLSFNFEMLGLMSAEVVVNLNKVIDNNYYPLDRRENDEIVGNGKISSLNKYTRPIGLGVSGLADVFYKLSVPYESSDAELLNKKIFACIYFNSWCSSIDLAIKEGVCEGFVNSPMSEGLMQFDLWANEAKHLKENNLLNEGIYDVNDDIPVDPSDWGQKEYVLSNGDIIRPYWKFLKAALKKYGARNSMITTVMPTASSSQIIRNAESTEAHQTNIYVRTVSSGSHMVVNRFMMHALKANNLWTKEIIDFIIVCEGSLKYLDRYLADNNIEHDQTIIQHLMKVFKTQFEISQKVCMKMARQRGIYIDQSQSLNIYFKDPDISKLNAVHRYGYHLRLKTGIYYLRAGAVSSTGQFGLSYKVKQYYSDLVEKLKISENILVTNKNIKISEQEPCLMCQ